MPKTKRCPNRAPRNGYTLIEMVVVTVILGTLSAFAIPAYMKASEEAKAQDAAAMLKRVGAANRMYALEHGGVYPTARGSIADSCNTGDCLAQSSDRCQLVRCKYLAPQDWTNAGYSAGSMNGELNNGTYSNICGDTTPAGSYLAFVARKGTTKNPYRCWAYVMRLDGTIIKLGTDAPDPH